MRCMSTQRWMLLAPSAPRLVLQGTKDSFGTPEQIRIAIGTAEGIKLVELPGADHSYRIGKSSDFTVADLRTTLVAEVSRFMGAVAGISTS